MSNYNWRSSLSWTDDDWPIVILSGVRPATWVALKANFSLRELTWKIIIAS